MRPRRLSHTAKATSRTTLAIIPPTIASRDRMLLCPGAVDVFSAMEGAGLAEAVGGGAWWRTPKRIEAGCKAGGGGGDGRVSS